MGITTIPTLNKPSALMGMPGVGGSLIKTTGNVFYVNGFTGLDTRTGLNPNYPLLTIAHALTHCVNDHDDYIIVLDHWQEAWPVTINVSRVHIIGVGTDPNHPFVALNAAADTAIFVLNNCPNSEIAGFSFGGGNTHGGIEDAAGIPMGVYIHDCVFGHTFAGDTPLNGIRIVWNVTDVRIENNLFLGNQSAGGGTLTGNGIHFHATGDTLGGVIKGNVFKGINGIGCWINLPLGVPGGIYITDNEFYQDIADGAPLGWAITLNGPALTAGCFVARNVASQTGDATGNNPYRDLSTGVIGTCLNGWVMNCTGVVAIVPSVV